MIYVIKPSGRGIKDIINFYKISLTYTIASIIASGLIGMFFAYVGNLHSFFESIYFTYIIIGVTLLYVLSEYKVIKMPMPQIRWQVPVEWIQRHNLFGAFAYGFTIGLGFLTYITFPGFYVLLMLIISIGDTTLGFIIGSIYGLFRSIILLTGSFIIHKNNYRLSTFSKIVFSKVKYWHWISGSTLLLISILLFYDVIK